METYGGDEGRAVDDPEQAEFLRDKPPVSYAYFKDPDGYWIEINDAKD